MRMARKRIVPAMATHVTQAVDAPLGGEPGEVRRVRGGRVDGGRDRAGLPDLPVGLQEVEVVGGDRAGDAPQDRDEEGPAEQDAQDEVDQRPPVHLPVEVPPDPQEGGRVVPGELEPGRARPGEPLEPGAIPLRLRPDVRRQLFRRERRRRGDVGLHRFLRQNRDEGIILRFIGVSGGNVVTRRFVADIPSPRPSRVDPFRGGGRLFQRRGRFHRGAAGLPVVHGRAFDRRPRSGIRGTIGGRARSELCHAPGRTGSGSACWLRTSPRSRNGSTAPTAAARSAGSPPARASPSRSTSTTIRRSPPTTPSSPPRCWAAGGTTASRSPRAR